MTQMLLQKLTDNRNNDLYYIFSISVFFIAILIRAKYLFSERMAQDEALYAWYAHRIVESPSAIFSKELLEYHPPLFALLLLPGHWVTPPELGYRAISIFINLVGIIIVFLLGNKMGGRFLGIFSAFCLAFNEIYLFFANLIGPDVGLVVFLSAFVLMLAYHDGTHRILRDCCLGLIGAGCIGLKWSGLLVIPIFILWCFFGRGDEVSYRQRLKTVLLPLSIMLIVTFGLGAVNYIQTGNFFPPSTFLTFSKGAYYDKPFWDYVSNLPTILSFFLILPFLLYGLLLPVLKKQKEDQLLAIWFWVCFIGISLSREKLARYGLLILPQSFLIAGRGLQDLINRLPASHQKMKHICYGFCIVYLVLFSRQIFPLFEKDVQYFAKSHTGFAEAGQWIKQRVAPDAVIYAASIRQIRYFSRVDHDASHYKIYLPPDDRNDFIDQIKSIHGNIILVIDRWDPRQPEWLDLADKQNYDDLKSLGFHLLKIVRRLNDKNEMREVVWLFSRPEK